ncbi:MAG: hypothetical protein AAGA59_09780 [Actinomycetota bacterium]
MRADWRFLLPWDRERAPLIRVPDGRRAAWMVDDGWAVPPEHPAEVDAVAVEEGPELDRVVAEERPALLVIWRRAHGDGLRRRRPVLGPLSAPADYRTRTYLALPDAAEPRTYLPLDPEARPVIADWLAARLPVPTAVAAVLAQGMQAVGRRRPGAGVGAERLTGADGADAATTGDAAEPGGDDSGPATVVTTSGHDEGSRAVRLRYRPGPDGEATAEVEKFANRPRYGDNSTGEQEALAEVRRRLPAQLAAAVPEPLGTDTLAGVTRVRESHLPGPTMAQALSRRTRPAPAEAALRTGIGWLDAVHEATAQPVRWTEAETEAWLRRPLADLPDDASRSASLRSLIEAVAARADGAQVATVLRHYDPGPWNLILGPRLGVIDWENRSPRPPDRRGPALGDHLYLSCYWRHLVVGAGSLDDERAASGLVEPVERRARWAVEASRRRVLASAEALGVDRRAIPALWVHNWLEQAVFTSLRRPDGAPGSGVEYLAWAGSDGAPLFARWGL